MIGLNHFERQWLDLRNDTMAAIEETGASGWYVLGREVKEFEEALGRYWGTRHVVGVASGLDAIELSLRALGCGPGDKVLTTPVSAFATTLAIVRLGAIPVFVDTEPSGLINLELAEAALKADVSIQYFVPVHLFGHPVDLHKLQVFSEERGIAIVEDCAQSIGARCRGRASGTVGAVAATSFYPTKNLGALGDGGAILTNDESLAAKCRVLRDYGQTAKYEHTEIGYNSRLDELQAAILRRSGLPRLDRWTERRRRIAARYLHEIRGEHVTPMIPREASEPSWHLFPVRVEQDKKQCFMQTLRRAGILTGEHYPAAIPDQPAMLQCRYEVADGGLAEARRFCRSEVSLPIHPYLSDDEVSHIVEAVNGWRR